MPTIPTWVSITPTEEPNIDVFKFICQAATQDLYSITPLDKALAVPYMKLWKLQGKGNTKVGNPITNTFTEAPKFGASAAQFSERPDASLTSLTVKKHNPGGWILYREVDMEITVHSPDALNRAQSPDNVVGALLQPGNNFYLEYGWVGGMKPIIGQSRTIKHAATPTTSSAAPTTPADKYSLVYDSVEGMRFIITTYNFSIQADGQFKFAIHGVEDGELQTREASAFDKFVRELPAYVTDPEERKAQIAAKVMDAFSPLTASMDIVISPEKDGNPEVKGKLDYIKFGDVANVLLAQPIYDSLSNLGYTDIFLYTGIFNKNSPITVDALGTQKTAGEQIYDFRLRFSDVTDLINRLASTGEQMTIQNVMKNVLELVGTPTNWKKDNVNNQMPASPEMQIFTKFSPRTGTARMQIVDRKRYLSILKGLPPGVSPEYSTKQMNTTILKTTPSFLTDNQIPKWDLYHRNSFFKDAKFEVVADEQMKSIFIGRAIKKQRGELASGEAANDTLPMGLLIYRSAIKGTVTTLGNFGFDLLGQVWVDFGVPEMNGIFYVLGKVDKVTAEGFFSEITLQSEGSNPMGAEEKPGWSDPPAGGYVPGYVLKTAGSVPMKSAVAPPAAPGAVPMTWVPKGP